MRRSKRKPSVRFTSKARLMVSLSIMFAVKDRAAIFQRLAKFVQVILLY